MGLNKIKILIVDDHQVVRSGIRSLLEDEDDMIIVGEACDGIDAMEKVKNLLPNVVLLDIAMPKMNGLETTEQISKKYNSVQTIIFSMHHHQDYIIKAVEFGANGYLLKDTSKVELLTAIRNVATGQKYFTNQISNILIESLTNQPNIQKENYRLSKKEIMILKHIMNGSNSREIAEILNLSFRTVDNHRAHIMKKTNTKNVAELVKLVMNEKILLVIP